LRRARQSPEEDGPPSRGRLLGLRKRVTLPTFAFVINLKMTTARGRTIPPSLLARADEVIE
jgi:hypothetical protein